MIYRVANIKDIKEIIESFVPAGELISSMAESIATYSKMQFATDWTDDGKPKAFRQITGEEMISEGNEHYLSRLKNELIYKDWFQTLPDFNAYVVRKNQALSEYAHDKTNWIRKSLINISKAGYFSSDRTILEYNCDIWHL